MSYRVFARKYRPQTFSEVVGQEHITRTLQNAIRADRLAQAYLLVGPRGIGKTSTARILAKALNCARGTSAEPCGVCEPCREIAEGNSLDVLEIDGASNNGVENIRDLRDKVQYAPARGPFKIFLIDEVHMLSMGAFNALLKTLEEPPPHVKFIFATTEAQKVPATITSRCQRFDLRRIPAPLIASHLLMIADKENIRLDSGAADAIARGADGGLRDAESMLDQLVAFCGDAIAPGDVLDVFGFTGRETIDSLLASLLRGDATSALSTVASLDEAGKDLARTLDDLIDRLRDLLVAKVSAPESDPLAMEFAAVSHEKLIELLEHFSAAEGQMRWATDKRMQVDVAVIKAVHLLEQVSLNDVIETIAALRDGQPAPALPPRQQAESTIQRPAATPPKPRPAPAKTPPAEKPSDEPAREVAGASEVADPVPTAPSAPSTTPPQSAESVGAATPWERVVARLAADSPFKFGWLETGIFQVESDGRCVVEFPSSQQSCGEGMLWAQSQKQLDEELSAEFGHPVHFHPEFIEGMPAGSLSEEDPPPQFRGETSPASPCPPESDGPAPVATPEISPPDSENDDAQLKEFLEDPQIVEALRIFEGELRLPAKSSQ